jgi:hypothetical protein
MKLLEEAARAGGWLSNAKREKGLSRSEKSGGSAT